MASKFNLTAELNLRGPANLRTVVADIRRQLSGVKVDVGVNVAKNAGRNIDNITNRLNQLNASLVQARTSTDQLNASFGQLAAIARSIDTVNVKASQSTKQHADSINQTAKAAAVASSRVEEFGKQSALAIKRFAAFSLPTVTFFALGRAVQSGIESFIDFDKQMVKLEQITGNTRTQLKSLSGEITRLSTTMGVSSSELAKVAETLAQAGLSAKDTTTALQALAKTDLAPSFDNLTQTTEGAIAAMRQFGLEAKDLERALGSINAVSAAFAVESGDIIAAIQRTGGVFASTSKGVSEGTDALNEFVAVFTSVRATTRESAETIATGLRTIFTRIQRAGTINQLKDYGIQLQDLEGKFVGPYEAVKRLSEGLKSLDPRDIRFSSIIEELGGFRQIGKVLPLIQQFATAQEALKVAQRGQGSLTDAQIKAQQSLSNQFSKVRENFLALMRDIGNSTAFQGLAKIVLVLSNSLIGLVGAFKPVLPILAVIGAIKGISAIGSFSKGFFGSKKQAKPSLFAGAAGEDPKEKATRERNEATARAAEALRINTDALNKLTGAITALDATIQSRPTSTFSKGGKVLGFNTGGIVPGNGGGDRVPALLEGGEVVINRRAAQRHGKHNINKLNRYAYGGLVDANIVNSNDQYIGLKKNDGTAKEDTFDIKTKRQYITLKNVDRYAGKAIADGEVVNFDAQGYKQRAKTPGWKQFEQIIEQLGYKDLNKSTKRNNYPIDFTKGGEWYDAKNVSSPVPDRELARKALHHILTETYKNYDYLTPHKKIKTRDENSLLKYTNKPITVGGDEIEATRTITQLIPRYEVDNNQKNIDKIQGAITGTSKQKGTLSRNANKALQQDLQDLQTDNTVGTLGARKILSASNRLSSNFTLGGLVQSFAEGGRIGYIDSDVIKEQLAGPKEKSIVDAMASLGLGKNKKKVNTYVAKLIDLAKSSRGAEEASVKKLSVLFGSAGSGKSSILTGAAGIPGRSPFTGSKPILTPKDIDDVEEVVIATSTVTPDKIKRFISDADEVYAISATTQAEQERIKQNRKSRDETGLGSYGRKAGATKTAKIDTVFEEALLLELQQQNQARGKSQKLSIFGRSDSDEFREKTGTELPSFRREKISIARGSFGPFTAGHEYLQQFAQEEYGIPPQAFAYLVAPDEGIDIGREITNHDIRTAILDQSIREAVVQLTSRKGKSYNVGATGRGDRSIPQGIEITKSGAAQRSVLLPGAGSINIVSKADASAKKLAKLEKASQEAGYKLVDIPRFEGISGSQVREAIETGDLTTLQYALNPTSYAIMKKNLQNIQNRIRAVPELITKNRATLTSELDPIDEKIRELGPDPANFKEVNELKNQRYDIISSYSYSLHKSLQELASQDPVNFAIDTNISDEELSSARLDIANRAPLKQRSIEEAVLATQPRVLAESVPAFANKKKKTSTGRGRQYNIEREPTLNELQDSSGPFSELAQLTVKDPQEVQAKIKDWQEFVKKTIRDAGLDEYGGFKALDGNSGPATIASIFDQKAGKAKPITKKVPILDPNGNPTGKYRDTGEIIGYQKSKSKKGRTKEDQAVIDAVIKTAREAREKLVDKYKEGKRESYSFIKPVDATETLDFKKQGLLFAGVGINGEPYSPKRLSLGSGLDVLVGGYILNDKDTRKEIEQYSENTIRAEKTAAEKGQAGVAASYLKRGKKLALDFDKTLVTGADLHGDDLDAFADIDKVKASLENPQTKLTILGEKLRRVLASQKAQATKTDLLSRMRVVTARPHHTVGILGNWLAQQGIPITDIKGVGGKGLSDQQVAEAKAALLDLESLFIDDNETNVRVAKEQGFNAIRYGAAEFDESGERLHRGQDVIEGLFLQNIIKRFSGRQAVGGINNTSMDFPTGLGLAAELFPGLDPDIPTDAKRTLRGASDLKSNITNYLKKEGRFNTKSVGAAQGQLEPVGFAGGGIVQRFSKAGQVDYDPKTKRVMNILGKIKSPTGTIDPSKLSEAELGILSSLGGTSQIGSRLFEAPGVGEMNKFVRENEADRGRYAAEIKTKNAPVRESRAAEQRARRARKSEIREMSETRLAQMNLFGGMTELDPEIIEGIDKPNPEDIFGALREAFAETTDRGKALAEEGGGFLSKFREGIKKKKFISATEFVGSLPNAEEQIKSARRELQSQSASTKDSKIQKSLADQLGKSSIGLEELAAYRGGALPANASRATKFAWTMSQMVEGANELAKGGIVGFANGGNADYYSLEKNSGFKSGEFDELVRFAKTNGFTLPEFQKYLTKRLAEKKTNSQLMMDPLQLAQALISHTPTPTDAQRKLADSLKGGPIDAQYNPKYDRVVKGFASGGLAEHTDSMAGLMRDLYGNRSSETPTKKQKNFGQIALRTGNRIQANYFDGPDRTGYVIADKMGDIFAVQSSSATSGYGPKLYDIVMEAATEQGSMLTSDRKSVSKEAKAVWDYYFNKRSDVKKIPLDPIDWVSNNRLLDEKLYGPPDTWPPYNDPAWVLQTGYQKNPSDINNPDLVQRLAIGGSASFASGGIVPARVSNGEGFVPPAQAKSIGYGTLSKMNQADRIGGFASGGSISRFSGPGSGTSDSIGPVGLPVGSFVIRKKAMDAMGYAKGGVVGLAAGGVLDKERLDYLDYLAKERGQTVAQYQRAEAGNVVKRANEIQSESKQAKRNLTLLGTSQRKNLGGVNVAATIKAGTTDANFAKVNAAVEAFTNQIQKADPTLSYDKARAAAIGMADALARGETSADSVAVANKTLKGKLDITVTSTEALIKAADDAGVALEDLGAEVTTDATGKIVGIKNKGSALTDQEFLQSRAGQRFGALGNILPARALQGFAESGFGKVLGSGADFIEGKSGGRFGNLSRGFAALGGFQGIGTGLAGASEGIKSLLPVGVTDDPGIAGTFGGLTGAGTGAAVGAQLGSFAGPIGTLIGGIGGAIVGGIKGYFEASNQAVLKGAFDKLSSSTSKLDDAFKRLDNEFTKDNFSETTKTLRQVAQDNVAIGKIATEEKTFSNYFTRPSDAVRQEALTGFISQSRNIATSNVKLGQIQASKLATTGQLDNASFSPILEQFATQDQKNEAAVSAYVAKMSEAGASEEQIGKILTTNRTLAIKKGLEFIAAEDALIKKNELTVRGIKEVERATFRLLDVYRKAGANAQRYGDELENVTNRIAGYIGDLTGAAQLQNVNRENEQVFANISAYSKDEIRAAAEQVSGFSGNTPETKELAGQAIVAKVLTDELPGLISRSGGDKGEIIKGLTAAFEAQGIKGRGVNEILSQIEKVIDDNNDKGTGSGSLLEDLDKSGVYTKASKTAEEAVKTLGTLQKQYNDTLQKLIDFSNQRNQIILKQNGLLRKAEQTRLKAELELADVLGKSISLDKLNKPFETEIKSLTSSIAGAGFLDGETLDPTKIGQAIQGAASRNKDLEQAILNEKAQFNNATTEEQKNQINQNIRGFQEELAKNKLGITEATEALEKLADDGTRAANALTKIQEKQQRGKATTDKIFEAFTLDPQQVIERNFQAGILGNILSGDRTALATSQGRGAAVAGLEQFNGILPKQLYNELRSQLLEAFLRSTGGLTEAQIQQQVESVKNEGIDPNDPLIQAYKEASSNSIDAMNALRLSQDAAREELTKEMRNLSISLNGVGNIFQGALGSSRGPAPDEKASGGRIRLSKGGKAVPVRVSNGEGVFNRAEAAKIGYSRLQKMNHADKNGHQYDGDINRFNGPGTGTSDSIFTQLEEGSYVIRAKAMEAMQTAANGGKIQRLGVGGITINGNYYPASDKENEWNPEKELAEINRRAEERQKEATNRKADYDKQMVERFGTKEDREASRVEAQRKKADAQARLDEATAKREASIQALLNPVQVSETRTPEEIQTVINNRAKQIEDRLTQERKGRSLALKGLDPNYEQLKADNAPATAIGKLRISDNLKTFESLVNEGDELAIYAKKFGLESAFRKEIENRYKYSNNLPSRRTRSIIRDKDGKNPEYVTSDKTEIRNILRKLFNERMRAEREADRKVQEANPNLNKNNFLVGLKAAGENLANNPVAGALNRGYRGTIGAGLNAIGGGLGTLVGLGAKGLGFNDFGNDLVERSGNLIGAAGRDVIDIFNADRHQAQGRNLLNLLQGNFNFEEQTKTFTDQQLEKNVQDSGSLAPFTQAAQLTSDIAGGSLFDSGNVVKKLATRSVSNLGEIATNVGKRIARNPYVSRGVQNAYNISAKYTDFVSGLGPNLINSGKRSIANFPNVIGKIGTFTKDIVGDIQPLDYLRYIQNSISNKSKNITDTIYNKVPQFVKQFIEDQKNKINFTRQNFKLPKLPQKNTVSKSLTFKEVTASGFANSGDAFEASNRLREAQLKARDIIAEYASSPEKARELLSKNNLFDVDVLELDPSLSQKVNALSGKTGGIGAQYSPINKAVTIPKKDSGMGLLIHEILHAFQHNVGIASNAKDPFRFLQAKSLSGTKALRKQMEDFLQPGGAYEKLVSDLRGNANGAGFYDSKKILDQGNFELLTNLGQAADTDAFKNNQAAQDMLKAIIKHMGFKNGGPVYANSGGLMSKFFKPKGADKIPAMLSEGEYVINPKATKENFRLLEAINNNKVGSYNKGGLIEELENQGREYVDREIDADDRYQIASNFHIFQREGTTKDNLLQLAARAASNRRDKTNEALNNPRGIPWEELSDKERDELIKPELDRLNSIANEYQQNPEEFKKNNTFQNFSDALDTRINHGELVRLAKEKGTDNLEETAGQAGKMGVAGFGLEKGYKKTKERGTFDRPRLPTRQKQEESAPQTTLQSSSVQNSQPLPKVKPKSMSEFFGVKNITPEKMPSYKERKAQQATNTKQNIHSQAAKNPKSLAGSRSNLIKKAEAEKQARKDRAAERIREKVKLGTATANQQEILSTYDNQQKYGSPEAQAQLAQGIQSIQNTGSFIGGMASNLYSGASNAVASAGSMFGQNKPATQRGLQTPTSPIPIASATKSSTSTTLANSTPIPASGTVSPDASTASASASSIDISGLTSAFDIFGKHVATFGEHVNTFGTHTTAFGGYVDKLQTAITDAKIELVGNYKVDVNITGAESIGKLEEKMKEWATEIVTSKVNELQSKVSDATRGAVKPPATQGKTNKER